MDGELLATIATSVVALAGTVAATVKWAVKRMVASQDRMVAAQDKATDALIENARSSAVLVTKIDAIADKLGVYTPIKKRRARTEPNGVRQLRAVPDDSDRYGTDEPDDE